MLGISGGEGGEKRIHCSLDLRQSEFTSVEKTYVEERTEHVSPDDFLRKAGVACYGTADLFPLFHLKRPNCTNHRGLLIISFR